MLKGFVWCAKVDMVLKSNIWCSRATFSAQELHLVLKKYICCSRASFAGQQPDMALKNRAAFLGRRQRGGGHQEGTFVQ